MQGKKIWIYISKEGKDPKMKTRKKEKGERLEDGDTPHAYGLMELIEWKYAFYQKLFIDLMQFQ